MRMVYVAYVTHHVTHESLERRAEHMTHELESRYRSDAALSEQLAQRANEEHQETNREHALHQNANGTRRGVDCPAPKARAWNYPRRFQKVVEKFMNKLNNFNNV